MIDDQVDDDGGDERGVMDEMMPRLYYVEGKALRACGAWVVCMCQRMD